MQNTKQAVFALGEYDYGFDIMDVNIIEKVVPIEPVTNCPKNFKGIIKLRGDVIPVYSLRRKFGLEDVPTNDDSRFIITTTNDMLVAYEVDQMKEIVPLEQEQLFEVPPIVKNADTSYMKSVTNVEGRLIILLNHNSILTEEEINTMKAAIK